MDNPLSGVMEWYQGLPQAAQIGIPVVGVGAVFLISRKGGSSSGGGSVVAGPFGSSSGGGQASSGAGNAGGSNGSGGSPSPKPQPKPIPPVRPPQPTPIPKPVPKSIPPGHGYHPPIKPVTTPKPEPIKPKAPVITKGHLPSSHIQQHPALAKPHLPSSHIMSAPNTKSAAVGYLPPQTSKTPNAALRSGKLYEGGPTSGPKITPTKVIPSAAKHPVKNKGLHNTVPAMKGHQYTSDQHKAASSTLAKRNNSKPTAL